LAYLDMGSWDMCCVSNNADHHTDLNGTERLIVRRGQSFTINLHLRSGAYEAGKHSLTLEAETGPSPSEEDCTKAVFCVSEEPDEETWNATVSSPDSGTLALHVSAAPNAPIGRYSLTLDQFGYRVSLGDFLLLFNAWCPRDAVFLDDEEARKEYVLSQDGIIFRGTYKYPIPSAWEYGQHRNYHCWVESWMKRTDLPTGYDGWQASDSTPQERSENVFCCGPVPLKAIKEGQLDKKYDAPFVFAEVNADVKTFMRRPDGSTDEVISSAFIGQRISTKSVASDLREDITHLYKYPEGSQEERDSFKRAEHLNKLQQDKEVGLDVKIKVSKEMRKGCDFDVFAIVKNNTSMEKKCRLIFASRAASYSGILGKDCGYKDLLNIELPPGGERTVPLRLNYSKYCNSLMEDNLIRLLALLVDRGTGDMILTIRNIVLENPQIQIRVLGEPKVNRKLAAEVTLKNPLPEPLTGCCFRLEGANLTGGTTITERLPSVVEAGQEAKVKVYFTPTHWGLRKLLVEFDSDKLGHVQGYRNVIIGK
ncbi:protein-glutamine gamma-glutamyltransferase 2, partial [Engraulis encrasicolus]|uniref:protein-glutamine gamma-glutamyltransferase 2 n=1 Tax=Engraulis encrasicolus TaxID=184585 RepID=UPI002FD3971A